jgi:ATP-binding protein involved in chromosome partitioning
VLAIASGKGGVGKSSVTVNLAVALAARGLTVGILDADIWGFSVPRLLGMEGDVEARQGKMVPLERRVGAGTLRVLSMGFLADEEQAIMWRGLVLNRAVQQFLQDAHWGDLDYLLIDLPPGTGDIQMGLARLLPRTELLVVTTPPVAAQKVAARAADMARRGYLRVAGVIENMSDFTCEHGTTYALFGSGGGARLAHGLGVPLVGSIPLHPDLAAGGDAGVPVALAEDGELASVFADMARVVAEEVAPLIQAEGCTARMLERVEAAVAQGEAEAG